MRKIELNDGRLISISLANALVKAWNERQNQLQQAIEQTIKDSMHLYNDFASINVSYACIIDEDGYIYVRFYGPTSEYSDVINGDAISVIRKEIVGLSADESNSALDLIEKSLTFEEYESLKSWAISNGYFNENEIKDISQFDLLCEIDANHKIWDELRNWNETRCSDMLEVYLEEWYELLDLNGEVKTALAEFGSIIEEIKEQLMTRK